tara:strand:- start:452 stop:646 length:195 start_codon:yes stop_codon:yes gene_type:complete
LKKNNFNIFLKNSRFRNKKFSDLDSHDILEFVSEFENKFKTKVNLSKLYSAKNWNFFKDFLNKK